jgi:DNA-binding CsgD family transcriptional regulator
MAAGKGSMTQSYHALTEKEKQTLRLLLTGHDAKSMARHLGLSVHTVNERLRDARRKLSVSSSKAAARLLREAEGADPETFGDNGIGDAGAAPTGQQDDQPGARSFEPRKAWAIGGLAMMMFAIAVLALSGAAETTQDRAAPSTAAARGSEVAETPATEAARQWLALVDAAKWQESFAATAQSFQSLNTVETWQSVSNTARVPLGRVLSRRLAGQERIPAPPNGYQLVRFRTSFANQAEATETLSLAREGQSWRVAGYFID